ncbi:hypothetical protein VNI00_007656 [Paramarasmius palmivorus]|uniref:Transmembrane protein n=1 Tax=Paramarasmius palmivorus TaxID=297713 RepID=A0AAW0D1Z0_9AGAR
MNISLQDDPSSEKRGFWEDLAWRRLRAWKAVKLVLEVVLGTWAVYNAVRYFLSYPKYSSLEGRAVALVLGSISAVCFALFLCEVAVAAIQPRPATAQSPSPISLLLRATILYIGCFFLSTSSVINLALTIAWRGAGELELATDSRCNLDIDTIWSVSSSKPQCPDFNWTAWLSLAIFRVAFTLILSLSLLIASSQCEVSHHPCYYTSYRPRHRHRRTDSKGASSTLIGGSTLRKFVTPPTRRSSSTMSQSTVYPSLRHPSRSSVSSRKTSHQSAAVDHYSTRTSHTFSNPEPPQSPTIPQTSVRDSCDEERQQCTPTPQDPLARLDPALLQQRLADAIYLSPSQFSDSSTNEEELNDFVVRFRSLVNQVARETEEAMAYARPDTYVREVDSDSESEESDLGSPTSLEFQNYELPFGFPRMPPRTLGYDEFGRPYPPDDHVRILNRYVRRMPTIESMGSREVASIWSYRDHARVGSPSVGSPSVQSLSRPSTRGRTDMTSSEPPSRANSLRLNIAAALATGHGISRPHTSGGSSTHSHHSGDFSHDRTRGELISPTRSGSSRPSTSRSTFSYHTINTSTSNAAAIGHGSGHGSPSSSNSTPSSDGFLSLSDDARASTGIV